MLPKEVLMLCKYQYIHVKVTSIRRGCIKNLTYLTKAQQLNEFNTVKLPVVDVVLYNSSLDGFWCISTQAGFYKK